LFALGDARLCEISTIDSGFSDIEIFLCGRVKDLARDAHSLGMRTSEEIEAYLGQHGIVSVREHAAWARTIQRLARASKLARILPGIYALPSMADDFRIRILAVLAKDPDAVITGDAALVLANVRTTAKVIEFHSTRQLRLPPGFRQIHASPPIESVLTRENLRFVAPHWAALRIAHSDNGAAIDDVLRARRATISAFHDAISRFRRSRGNRLRRRVLWESRDEPWSQGERNLHQLLRQERLSGWTTNLAVESRGRLRYLDVAFPQLKLAIEFDGREVHAQAAVFEDDRERQNALVADGWTVLRVTWAMLSDPHSLMRLIKDVLSRLSKRPRFCYAPSSSTA